SWGNFHRVAKTLYYRLDHPNSLTHDWARTPSDRKRAVLMTLFTGLLEASVPLCRTPEQRIFFQQFILDRIVSNYLNWPGTGPDASEKFIAECLERLKFEGNSHLLRQEELPPILQELKHQPDKKVLERSRMRRIIYRMRQRSRMARVI